MICATKCDIQRNIKRHSVVVHYLQEIRCHGLSQYLLNTNAICHSLATINCAEQPQVS